MVPFIRWAAEVFGFREAEAWGGAGGRYFFGGAERQRA